MSKESGCICAPLYSDCAPGGSGVQTAEFTFNLSGGGGGGGSGGGGGHGHGGHGRGGWGGAGRAVK